MQITINNRTYQLHFGLGFLQEMNKRHSAEFEGVKTGYGAMALFSAGQYLNDPLAFVDLLRAATAGEYQKPSNDELETYISGLIVKDEYEKVFLEMMDEIKKSPLLAKAMGEEVKAATAPLQSVPVQPQATDTIPTQTPSQF